MNDHSCDHPCVLACPDVCALRPVQPEPIVLEEALARFQQEAVRGVCDTGRYRLSYYVWGQGAPLLFVHGVSDTSLAFVQPISRLSAHFRCIAYDLPGTPGDSSRFGRYRHEDLVADIWALLDHLGLKQSYIFGSSFGTTITLRALQQRPEKLPRAILQAGFAHRPLRRLEWLLAHLGRWVPGAMKQLPWRIKVAEQISKADFHGRPDADWQYYLECSGRPPIATFARQALIVNQVDLRLILGQVRQPVLLLCGERDKVIRTPHQQMLLDGLANAGRVTIEGCGHIPSYSHPEILAEVVRQFLTPPSS